MGENICCPFLDVIECADTDQHSHLYCDSQFTLEQVVKSNDWVKDVCLGDFKRCKYYPKDDGENLEVIKD